MRKVTFSFFLNLLAEQFIERDLLREVRILMTQTGDWLMFAAAVANSDTKQKFISNMATWIKETNTDRPLTDIYQTDTGT